MDPLVTTLKRELKDHQNQRIRQKEREEREEERGRIEEDPGINVTIENKRTLSGPVIAGWIRPALRWHVTWKKA